MKKLRQTLFKTMAGLLCFISTGVYAQKQTKTIYEVFNTTAETVLDINTTHTDIEFETWTKNQISIEANIEFDGATEEEIKNYFNQEAFEIMGNSKKVTIKTGAQKTRFNSYPISNVRSFTDFDFEEYAFPEIDSLHIAFTEIDSLPEMPNFTLFKFDHKAYEKGGDIYMKKWQQSFRKGFDKEDEKELEEWSKQIAAKALKRQELSMKRSKAIAERALRRAERKNTFVKRRIDSLKRREIILKSRGDKTIFISSDTENDEPHVFYFSSKGENKKYKVKKTIKVKIPKGMKIDMNVRHGEVKLAGITKDLNADISHSSLWAANIDGSNTEIKASYSPVTIQKWNYGQLQVDYSDAVDLQEVGNLRLTSTSSEVIINRLVHSAYVNNKFGPLKINSIATMFSDLDIALQNGELDCKLPDVPFTIYVNGTNLELEFPSKITLASTKNQNTVVHKGYNKSKNANKSIVINASYSDVTLK